MEREQERKGKHGLRTGEEGIRWEENRRGRKKWKKIGE